MSSAADIEALERRVRVAARALARHGLVQAWGHCSARIDDERLLVCAARPMGRIDVGEAGTIDALTAAWLPNVIFLAAAAVLMVRVKT